MWYEGLYPKLRASLLCFFLTPNLPALHRVAAVRQPYQLFKSPRALVAQLPSQLRRQPLETYVSAADGSSHRGRGVHVSSCDDGGANRLPVVLRRS
jgi:hypothetical protein